MFGVMCMFASTTHTLNGTHDQGEGVSLHVRKNPGTFFQGNNACSKHLDHGVVVGRVHIAIYIAIYRHINKLIVSKMLNFKNVFCFINILKDA